MPEGPEVETIRRTLEASIVGQRIESVWRSNFPLRTPTSSENFEFLVGSRIKTLSRVGKVLIVEAEGNKGLFIQFGMSGRLFFPKADSPLENHTHLRVRFERSKFELRFVDPRRFGDVKPYRNAAERKTTLAKLGPDGINLNSVQVKKIAASISTSRRPIKAVLLDQSVVSGVGNIYACEALHVAKVSPLSQTSDLSVRKIEKVLDACKEVMTTAVNNKGTTFLSYLDGNGEKGKNQNYLRVFARENKACPICSTKIDRIVQSGRSTFYCQGCQN